MADIYGANLYNHYLQSIHRARAQVQAQGGSTSQVVENIQHDAVNAKNSDSKIVEGSHEHCPPESCSSILVCTGVYNHERQELSHDQTVTEQRIFHGHRDFCFDPSLTQPSFVVHDVHEAVELVFQQEGWTLE